MPKLQRQAGVAVQNKSRTEPASSSGHSFRWDSGSTGAKFVAQLFHKPNVGWIAVSGKFVARASVTWLQ